MPFYSVDFEIAAHARAKRIAGVEAYHMNGEDFLRGILPALGDLVGFAYLDSFDWRYSTTRKSTYRKLGHVYRDYGFELSNENSQAACLGHIRLLEPHVAHVCIVLLDDTWPTPDNGFDGKGGLAVPYLLSHGWTILQSSEPARGAEGGYVMLTNETRETIETSNDPN